MDPADGVILVLGTVSKFEAARYSIFFGVESEGINIANKNIDSLLPFEGTQDTTHYFYTNVGFCGVESSLLVRCQDCNQVTGPKPYIELKEADATSSNVIG